ncbi:HNH endonuclease [Bacillus phage PBC2]|uniref:AP2 domain-containing protein n=1 Tax=Bacillus phage PBC2 TaxID=1675029 RepID=A0A218KBX4_9CAUD|nr:HNH endonuclease [Bacillus phage PBC2]AKQ08386.1 hypothetical protein PBC2_071 [Bacillus phage PBC2]
MRSDNKRKERIGEVNTNSYGSKMTIIEYKSNKEIVVEFDNGEIIETNYSNFKKGNIKSSYDISVCGVGYEGLGIYKPKINNKITESYTTWRNMIKRCYDVDTQNKQPSYKDCTVAEEWHNYQNFAEWYNKNYYEIDGQRMHLDKDILIKGNKIYSPETCVFVPQCINALFIKRDVSRGKCLIGVYYDNHNKKYKAQCNDCNGKRVNLGLFNNEKDAFDKYKVFKESVIKEFANRYVNNIPDDLYVKLVNYEVDIRD